MLRRPYDGLVLRFIIFVVIYSWDNILIFVKHGKTSPSFQVLTTVLRVYGESAHLHRKFAQNFAVKLSVEFCNLSSTPKLLWKRMPKSMRYKFVIKFN